jgi:NAD(P)-dependent dehydrogenase (short-subunit alcohol dehydrogenase family)
MSKQFDFRPDKIFSLEGQTIMVTGAAGQLGSATVSGLLDSKANVIATDLSQTDLEQASERWTWDKDRVVFSTCDIRNQNDIDRAFQAGKKTFKHIDGLVNNAGVSVFEPFLERPEASIDLVMDINLKGTILLIKEFIKFNRGTKSSGSIVNISSHYGLISPDPRIYTDCDRKNSEIYGATKAGIVQMTKYYSVHAAPYSIRVNAISPGGIRNPDNPQGEDFQQNYNFRCPLGRMAETEEMIGAIVFLLSPAASYITGHNLVVDGGMTCW